LTVYDSRRRRNIPTTTKYPDEKKVGRSGGVELVKPASPRLVSKPFARRERLTRATKRDDDETRRYASKT
jgi:hypothetical protein